MSNTTSSNAAGAQWSAHTQNVRAMSTAIRSDYSIARAKAMWNLIVREIDPMVWWAHWLEANFDVLEIGMFAFYACDMKEPLTPSDVVDAVQNKSVEAIRRVDVVSARLDYGSVARNPIRFLLLMRYPQAELESLSYDDLLWSLRVALVMPQASWESVREFAAAGIDLELLRAL
jgi:hypothetical protein